MKGYWNGEPAEVERVFVVVGPAPVKTWWFAGLEGTQRKAVRVTYGGETFYLDNEDGQGWLKVTKGRGSPHLGHNSLTVEKEVGPGGEP